MPILFFLLLFLPGTARAEDSLLPDPGTHTVTQSNGDIDSIIHTLQQNLLADVYLLLGAVAVILLIVAGIQYMLSGGDPAKAKTARGSILNIVLGIIVLAASYLIIELITSTAAFFAHKL